MNNTTNKDLEEILCNLMSDVGFTLSGKPGVGENTLEDTIKALNQHYYKLFSEIIGEDDDPKKPPYTDHDYGFMAANAKNHYRKKLRQALNQRLGEDKE